MHLQDKEETENIVPVTSYCHLFCASGLWPIQTASCAGWLLD